LVHFYQTAWCYNLKTSIFVLTTVRTSNPNWFLSWKMLTPWVPFHSLIYIVTDTPFWR
jgi:hypothetical protein